MKLLLNKITNQKNNPKLFFFDIDATISTRSLFGFFANKKTSHILQNNTIPYIVITGRTAWYSINELELQVYGLHTPDAVITSNGTTLLWRNEHGNLEEDTEWLSLITKNWDEEKIKNICRNFYFSFQVFRKKMYTNKPLFLYYVRNAPIKKLFQELEELKRLLPKNVKIDISESSLMRNDDHTFSGGIFVVPEICGKAGVVNYILSKLETKKIDVFLFGDACIDIPMLSLPSTKNHIFHSYLVNPTPLAKQLAQKNSSIIVTDKKGPQMILSVIARSQKDDAAISATFNPAQNNQARILIKLFESPLNSIIHKNLSPNDISLLGLQKVQESIALIQSNNIINRVKGIGLYLFGNFTDILDGIRARSSLRGVSKTNDAAISNSLINQIPGQLVDGFCDRAKEFYQLFQRAKKRLNKNKEKGLQTCLATLSCSLPSIARAQAELQNIIVSEKDDQGGSMIDRTKLLVISFFFQAIGIDSKSFEVDKEIHKRNMATFENRINQINNKIVSFPEKEKLNNFQKKALERFLLYVQILQEEYDVIARNPELVEGDEAISKQSNNETIKQFLLMIDQYLKLNISKLRKQYGFQTYPLLSLKAIK